MVGGIGIGENLTEIISALPPEWASLFGGFISVLKALGLLLVIYIGYLIISSIWNYKRTRKVNKIYEEMHTKLDRIDKKLNILLGKKDKKKSKKK